MGGGGIESSSSAVFFGAACLCIIHMSSEMQDKHHSRGKQGGSKAHHQHAIGIIRCPPSFRREGVGHRWGRTNRRAKTYLVIKSMAWLKAWDSMRGVSAGPTTGMLLTTFSTDGAKFPNKLRIPKISTCTQEVIIRRVHLQIRAVQVHMCMPKVSWLEPQGCLPARPGGLGLEARGRLQRERCQNPAIAHVEPKKRTPARAQQLVQHHQLSANSRSR